MLVDQTTLPNAQHIHHHNIIFYDWQQVIHCQTRLAGVNRHENCVGLLVLTCTMLIMHICADPEGVFTAYTPMHFTQKLPRLQALN